MGLQTRNPYTHQDLKLYKTSGSTELEEKISAADKVFQKFKTFKPSSRVEKMQRLAKLLRDNSSKYAKQISLEMGKPFSQAKGEIEKCAWVCAFYADNAPQFLESKIVKTDDKSSYINYEPLGVILAIMPWNYPFWQVFRVIAPNLMLGNSILIKHAPNTLGCGEMIQGLVEDAGFKPHSVGHIIVKVEQIESIINHKLIKAVTLTGSTKAGSIVASQAGKAIKKSVLELGGSNALVVFEDADLEKTAEICVKARFQNTGQSCIAGKRLLVHNSVYDEFMEKIKAEIQQLNIGNPFDNNSDISVMAREDLAEALKSQLDKSVKMGATISHGGQQDKTYFEPTLVENVTPDMPIFKEETFGPVLAVTAFKDEEEAVKLINTSKYGLGVSLFTENKSKYQRLISQIEDGAVFVNSLVKSDPRLPFGGTKHSGYGRELGREGILEFANIKTVYIQ
ncbi:NAD-dependent succinate-semialdehyde dehydrogenase [Mesohalobacter halotolerans]|uniref:NAD-dependent succinate-semialdehyde dehydrogenase n=1 Tax=Mesohalobacter halotolerans TaxID=1883405 RepID=A0A4V6ALE9_9FLAO|nr:NAD-dependent succinate-semialdehyde dehydrogenase [Mesohalobacter halotolerans]MBS3739242.1 NAD-dependent succinate-semialdehyde dehydrogenase [Psychroflexus sp.]TKS56515.1 NAD-dependent succinate-semialdehyde dehydrogenase [Mesohalobacter halotolerans]